MRFLAFIRAINVGGKRVIRMAELRECFKAHGFLMVQTYIQSGNISFEFGDIRTEILEKRIETIMSEEIGIITDVIIRKYDFIQEMMNDNPFKYLNDDGNVKHYVCFLKNPSKINPVLPLLHKKEGLELIRMDKKEAYIISKRIKGRFGFPNNFIEKELDVISTARNWKTLQKIIKI
ncbi:MAG: DUF1697 domain-containing protein [Mangrovibacterium sp.]